MKRKLLILELALLGLLGLYSAAGWIILRGAGAYRTGTTLGLVLAASRPYTTLAAALLLVLNLILLLRVLRHRSARKTAAGQEKLTPQKGTAAAAEAETVSMDDETLPMADETVPMADETVPMGAETVPMADETVPMSGDSVPGEKSAQTDTLDRSSIPVKALETGKLLPRRKRPAAEADQMPAPEKPVEPSQTAAPVKPAAKPAKCAVCGAPLKPGQKFCNQCGTPTGNGGGKS